MIRNNDSFQKKFDESFPGFNGGFRELRFMAGALGIDIDTYQNSLSEIKRYIGIYLQSNSNFIGLSTIDRYLKESKVDIDAFDFIGVSRSQLW